MIPFSPDVMALGINSNDYVPKKIFLAKRWVELNNYETFYAYQWLSVERDDDGRYPFRSLSIKLFQERMTVELHINGEFVEALPLYNVIGTINVTSILRMIESGDIVARSRGWI